MMCVLWLAPRVYGQSAETKPGFEGYIAYKAVLTDEESEGLDPLFADSLTLWVKGQRMLYRYSGGGFLQPWLYDVLIDAGENMFYMLDRENKVVYEKKIEFLELDDSTAKIKAAQPRYEYRKKTASILGYTCKEYEGSFTLPMQLGLVRCRVCATSKLAVPATASQQQSGSILWEPGLNGAIPLRKEQLFMDRGLRMTLTAVKIAPLLLDDDFMAIPSGWERRPFNPKMQVPLE